jgi:protein-ribulosamine 3-kinase
LNLPAFVTEAITHGLGEAPVAATPVGGGCIHDAACVETVSGRVFAKWSADAAVRMFEIEADGLRKLAATGTVSVPTVIAQTDQALILSWVETTPGRASAMSDAGRQLAHLHAQRGQVPGAEQDGYIGTLAQKNTRERGSSGSSGSGGWLKFFRAQRVEALTSCLPTGLRTRIEALDFEGLLEEPDGGCALLHGDLWGGNLVCGADGRGWLVDPAVYGGHPEVDLAMTTLFGGFSGEFYDAYQEVAGIFDVGMKDRLQLLNVYPLLVHVHLFGGGYQAQLDAIARRFS